MASKLFLLLKSPHEFTGLSLINNLAGGSRKGTILFEDAVYYAVDAMRGKQLLEVGGDIYVMADDLAAR
ncbi:MAG TPA: DsrH/TusB family sulfur metabolism protein, partial [Methanomassiliicoccales archaeon]|nr:DsrH/TusB family sulfur metabolism protein [Methanomassiliicoccales archaeon]